MESQSSFSNKRFKILGAVIAGIALVIVGVVAVSNTNGNAPVMALERAQALARVENANVPMSQVPDESEVHVPHGWQVESDEPVEGPGSEEEEEEKSDDAELTTAKAEEDDDIDSPLDVEEDEEGQKYVAELGEDVIVEGAEDSDSELEAKEDESVVAADGVVPKRCQYKLKKCGYRKRCVKKCKKRCKPYAIRKCKAKKFCKCFCKYYGKIAKARRCVIYKRKTCITGLTYKCRRGCSKYCRRVPRCYCCAKRHILEKCKKLCRYLSYKTKCGKCRCRYRKCVRKCRFVCRRYKGY